TGVVANIRVWAIGVDTLPAAAIDVAGEDSAVLPEQRNEERIAESTEDAGEGSRTCKWHWHEASRICLRGSGGVWETGPWPVGEEWRPACKVGCGVPDGMAES